MAGFNNLTREDAARILHGDAIDADDFDGHETPFQSGADVCEALAGWFGFTGDEYDMIAAGRRAELAIDTLTEGERSPSTRDLLTLEGVKAHAQHGAAFDAAELRAIVAAILREYDADGERCACGRELHADGTCPDGGAWCG